MSRDLRKVTNAWQNALADHGFINPIGVHQHGTTVYVTVYQWNPPMVRNTEIECRMRKSISDAAERYGSGFCMQEFTTSETPRPGTREELHRNALHRLYYWFRGAPEGRPGGPWWYRDFEGRDALNAFLRDCEPFLYKYAVEQCPTRVYDRHAMDIAPPKHLDVIENR